MVAFSLPDKGIYSVNQLFNKSAMRSGLRSVADLRFSIAETFSAATGLSAGRIEGASTLSGLRRNNLNNVSRIKSTAKPPPTIDQSICDQVGG